jgi:hypothetical protein
MDRLRDFLREINDIMPPIVMGLCVAVLVYLMLSR